MVALKIIDDEFQENEGLTSCQRKDVMTKEMRIDSAFGSSKEIENVNEESNAVIGTQKAEQFKDKANGCKLHTNNYCSIMHEW